MGCGGCDWTTLLSLKMTKVLQMTRKELDSEENEAKRQTRLQNRDKDRLCLWRLCVLLTCPEIIRCHRLTGSELQTKISRRDGREGRSSLHYWFSYSIKGSKCCLCISVNYLNNRFMIQMSFYWRTRRPKWAFLQIQKRFLSSLSASLPVCFLAFTPSLIAPPPSLHPPLLPSPLVDR